MKRINNNLIMFEAKTIVLLYTHNNRCYLFDSGNSEECKNEVLDYISNNHLKLEFLINTHCHSDHCQFNNEIQEKTGCKVCCSEEENLYINNEQLQLNMLYGGNSSFLKDNKFLFSKKGNNGNLPKIENLQFVNFPGHSYNMVGILIENEFLFIGDALFSEREMEGFPYLYDVEKFLESLSLMEKYHDKVIISSHIGIIGNNIKLIELNRQYVYEVIRIIKKKCSKNISYEKLFTNFMQYKKLLSNNTSYFLYNSTFKSYLNYMIINNIIKYTIRDNSIFIESNS